MRVPTGGPRTESEDDGANPFAPLYAGFNTGDPAEKHRNLPAFPEMIDVELTSACNFRCVFCPTGLGILDRPTGLMRESTWRAIVDECAARGTALRIIGWGEGTLHPGLVRCIAYASRAGLLTHLNTNASKITPTLAEDLTDAGLSSIKVSFQGIDKASYSAMRRVDFFDGMLKALTMLRLARGVGRTPFIAASTSVTGETPEQIAQFRELLEPLVDWLAVGRTTFDFLDGSAERMRPKQRAAFESARGRDSARKTHPVPCPEVYGKLSIAWDGTGRVCCNDYDGLTDLGKIGTVSIAAMWLHGVIEEYRARLARKEYSGPLCSVCHDYQSLSEA